MAQINIKLGDDQLEALRQYARRQRTPVSWLIKDYVDYLIGGGKPVTAPTELPSSAEMAARARHGGAFDWLEDEPDLYTVEDGEPV